MTSDLNFGGFISDGLPSLETTIPFISPERKIEPGKRYDSGKARYDLIPPEALNELAKVYTKGAEKYGDRNWEKGMSWSRCFGSLCRHTWAFWRGEDYDEETGCHHLAMVAWNAFAILTYYLRKTGTDDRPT